MFKAMRNFFGSTILWVSDFKMIELTAANAGFTEPGLGVALDTGRKIGPRGWLVMDSGCFMVGATVITPYETIFLGVCCHFLVCLYNIRTYIHTYLPTYIHRDRQPGRQADRQTYIHTVYIYIYGCFQKWWYPKIIHFNRVFHYKTSILGYHHFRKHPYIHDMLCKPFELGIKDERSAQVLGGVPMLQW